STLTMLVIKPWATASTWHYSGSTGPPTGGCNRRTSCTLQLAARRLAKYFSAACGTRRFARACGEMETAASSVKYLLKSNRTASGNLDGGVRFQTTQRFGLAFRRGRSCTLC